MAYKDNITTSLHGRRFGLQNLTTGESGGSRGDQEYLVGPEALRAFATTADTTDVNLHPHGASFLTSGTSAVYTLDPPVPGVRKTIVTSTSGPAYVKTANDETIVTTKGSSFTTIKATSVGVAYELVGITTAVWGGLGLSTAAGFTLTTST